LSPKISLVPELKEVKNLLLDDFNPRLDPSFHGNLADQIKIALEFEKKYDIFIVGRSLANNGFFAEEPLIGLEKDHKIIIVEGNRRLSALKFMTDDDFYNASKAKVRWDEIRKLMVGNEVDFSQVPVVVHKNREELTAILGFRHIAGTLKWDEIHRAKFINEVIEGHGESADFYLVGREMGSRRDTIRNNYVAYRVYLQAKSFNISTEGIEAEFGKFYTALNESKIKNYVGLDTENKVPYKLREPINADKANELKDFISYLYGDEKNKAVIDDSRELGDLADVLDSKIATEVLNKTRDIEKAKKAIFGDEIILLNTMDETIELFEIILNKITEYSKNAKVISKFKELSDIFEEIKNKIST
jgi:hypothetical protein